MHHAAFISNSMACSIKWCWYVTCFCVLITHLLAAFLLHIQPMSFVGFLAVINLWLKSPTKLKINQTSKCIKEIYFKIQWKNSCWISIKSLRLNRHQKQKKEAKSITCPYEILLLNFTDSFWMSFGAANEIKFLTNFALNMQLNCPAICQVSRSDYLACAFRISILTYVSLQEQKKGKARKKVNKLFNKNNFTCFSFCMHDWKQHVFGNNAKIAICKKITKN